MTETELADRLREKDWAVLRNIADGNNDVQKITATTTLENYHVTYCFEKLEELDLITVTKPGGTVERTIDGQKRVFQHPKKAKLTDTAEQLLNASKETCREYDDLNHNELVEKVHRLEERVESLDQSLNTFKKQIQRQL